MAHLTPVPLTVEENELIDLWLERPVEQRTIDQVPEFAEWVVAQRPALLPKGGDDAAEYLVRLLADVIADSDGAAP